MTTTSYSQDFNTNTLAAEREVRNFGVCDSKGREIGALALRAKAEFTTERTEGSVGYFVSPGTKFCYRPVALRDGGGFGAYQGWFFFDTEAAREEAVAKYFANAAKRAAKKAVRS